MKSLRRQWDNLFNKIHLNQVDIFYEICGYWLERSEFKANSKTMVTHFQLLASSLCIMCYSAGEFLKECILLAKEFAAICTASAVLKVAYTVWNHYPHHRKLKQS